MSKDTIEKGRRYFCREETTGKRHSGMFHIDDDDMLIQLFAFDDERLTERFDDLLIVRLEDNRILSAHNNITSGPSSNMHIERGVQSASTRVTSNIVVIGEDAWQITDPIRRVQFSIDHADELLLNPEKFDAIADAEFGHLPEVTLFELTVDGMTVKVWYPASGGLRFKRPTEIGVRYEIEFETPRNLNTYLNDVLRIVRFVSTARGHRLAPSDIRISRLSTTEFLAAAEARSGYHDHGVSYLWPVDPPKGHLRSGRAFVHVRDAGALEEFLACLRRWIKRDDIWHAASSLMMGAFKLQQTISGERLLNACTWLEEIPGANSALAASEEDIEAIAAVAGAEAERRGLKDYRPRIAGVIRGQLKKESNAKRFERLRRDVVARFGAAALAEDIVKHLLSAMKYRASVAHGLYEPEDETDFQAFSHAIYSLEAICFLLTIKDLPFSGEGVRSASQQQIVVNHRQHSPE